jgi:uroporphyrinogen decarboxylase
MQVSFVPEFARRLEAELQIKDNSAHNPHGGGNTYELERALDQDVLLVSVGWVNSYYLQEGDYVDEWAVPWKSIPYRTPFGEGRYTEVVGHPLERDETISSYRPPDPNRPELYADAARLLDAFRDEYWICGVTVTTILETATALRGYKGLFKDMLRQPDVADAVLDIPFRFHMAAAKRLVEMGVDMIWLGDDVGGQDRMLISPAHWRRYLKPRMAELIAGLKAINPEVQVAYHSDGAIQPIIPELIEIGLDILNPVQPACMDPGELKRQFGDRLCFWGSIDEQFTLPFAKPADVGAEVVKRLKTIGREGGLIIGPTHNVQLDTPMENFWAMMNAIASTSCASLA